MITYFALVGGFLIGVAFGVEFRPWWDEVQLERREARRRRVREARYERRPFDREELDTPESLVRYPWEIEG